MKNKMKLEVPPTSWLVSQMEQCANIYYLSGGADPSPVEKIELRRISDIDPHKRLNSLIQKGLLEEAEVSRISE